MRKNLGLFFPESRSKEDKDRVDLKPAGQHKEGKKPLPKYRDMGIVVSRAYTSQTWAYVPQSGSHSSKRRDEVKPYYGHQYHTQDKEAQHKSLETENIGHDVSRYH